MSKGLEKKLGELGTALADKLTKYDDDAVLEAIDEMLEEIDDDDSERGA